MKYGVNMMVWSTHVGPETEPLLARIREWGFDGVEPFLSLDEPVNIPAVRKILDGLGLQRTTCAVIPREAHLVSPDPEVRKRGAGLLVKFVERSAELGAELICGPLYAGLGVMSGSRRTAEEWKWAVEALQKGARRAQEMGITFCIEPLNRFETYFLNTLDDATRLVRDVNSPSFGIHFDTFHANIEEKHPTEALRAAGKAIRHVHISENDRGIPGTGHNDWRGVLRTLKEIGYKQWMTIESFAQPEPALAAAAAIWRDMAPSGDELARQGLKFIKGLAKEEGIA